jgi:hypothetical protein
MIQLLNVSNPQLAATISDTDVEIIIQGLVLGIIEQQGIAQEAKELLDQIEVAGASSVGGITLDNIRAMLEGAKAGIEAADNICNQFRNVLGVDEPTPLSQIAAIMQILKPE